MEDARIEELAAPFDGSAAAALLLKLLKREKDGHIASGPPNGNVCSVFILVDSDVIKLTHAADKVHSKYYWRPMIQTIVRKSDYRKKDPKIIGWVLSSHKFYNLQPGDVFYDTRENPKYVRIPSRRARKSKRVRQEGKKSD